jgi:hypothetical protein
LERVKFEEMRHYYILYPSYRKQKLHSKTRDLKGDKGKYLLEDEAEDVINYCISLRKQVDIVTLKRKH